MLRRTLALAVQTIAVATSSVATADTFGGWIYSPPPGYQTEELDDHVEWTKVGDRSFCAIAVFDLRPLRSSVAVEKAYEWHNVVTPTFVPKVTRRATFETAVGDSVAATTATLVTADGTTYAGTHYMVMPPGMIGSVLVTSDSTVSLRACERVAAAVVRSLDVDWASPRFNDPEARVETPQGRWAIAGPTSREYTFAADGSYRFHSETSTKNGARIVDDEGSYRVRGNQLTLTPRSATITTVTSSVTKRTAVPLAKAMYTWSRIYVPETNEWRLVLVPRKASARDRDMPAAGASYSDREQPSWRMTPGEPAI